MQPRKSVKKGLDYMSIIEILQQIFGATEEQTNSFSEAMRTNGIYTTAHENMDIRYPKMKANYEGSQKQLDEANKLIEDMKKSTKGQDELQGKITAYEGQVQQLLAELEKTKIDAAIKVALLSEKVVDVDYVSFKLNEKLRADGETLTLDDNGNIKGWDKKLEGLKTQFPNQFESSDGNGDGYEVYKPNNLRKPDKDEQPVTSLKNMNYEQRRALKEKNPTLFKQLSGN